LSRDDPRRDSGSCGQLYAYTLGLLRPGRIRRILELAGHDVRTGLPPRNGTVAVWGDSPKAWRGRLVARWRGASILNVEDAFLRSVRTGRDGTPPLGLVIDRQRPYFDCRGPSDLEDILNRGNLSDPDLLERAGNGISRIKRAHLSKYNAFDPSVPPPAADYVLVIDQTRNDASIRLGGADAGTFRRMLAAARAENPGCTILIKTHPEVSNGKRRGYFSAMDVSDGDVRLVGGEISPHSLLKSAKRVYCVTSLMGFEALLWGHRPRVFGRPFYSGWGLTDDEHPAQRRERALSVEELFAGAMLRYPIWYDPFRDRLCEFEDVLETLEAQARAWREDHRGYDAYEIRLWKRGHLRKFLSDAGRGLRFVRQPHADGPPALVWAGKLTRELERALGAPARPVIRLEDGFLRSRGLGAELVPPLSLVLDDLGIYYDPRSESRLERILNNAENLPAGDLQRAARLRRRLLERRLGKYNVGKALSQPPQGQGDSAPTILVPGQVEDDASILTGAGKIRRNIDLLRLVRKENPAARILYKPHPDVEAGLRAGAVRREEALELADAVLEDVDAISAIEAVDELWTMTSLIGFEALIRGKRVTCTGAPFYAGWGLTRDLGPVPVRRKALLSVDALIWGCLIAYPRYFDPVTGTACPVEVVVDRLAQGREIPRSTGNKALARLQGLLASASPFWR